MRIFPLACVFFWICGQPLFAQNGSVRGRVTDKETAEELIGALISLRGTKYNTTSDASGDYSLTDVPVGEYFLTVYYASYDSLSLPIKVEKNRILTQNLAMIEAVQTINVEVSSERTAEKNETRVSVINITPEEIDKMPSIGGKSDIAQFLQMTPGVTFTGDQGGQFFIRGGAPIQNKILLDGMTIYNAFHSIGFYSVFETDVIRTADVYTGGFGAQYGGRASAVIDVRTREGNKKRLSGNLTLTPFMASALVEAPIIQAKDENSPSLSFFLTAKHSYLQQSSPILYKYANAQGVLPFNFTDIYGKLSFNSPGGSRFNLSGFSFNDNTNFQGTAQYKWNSGGAGANFRIVPSGSNLVMGGSVNFSAYKSSFVEGDSAKVRNSSINSFAADFIFTYLMANSRKLDYGIEINSFLTNFNFENNRGIPLQQQQTNTEAAVYARYSGRFGRLVLDPSVRGHFYASLGEFRFEPRLALKLNLTDWFRIKAAGGLYSQNLISSVDQRDVVNLFVGFLGGPESGVFRIENGAYIKQRSRLQTSIHGIFGLEFNLGKNITLNVEPYWKYFPQIVNLNRNATSVSSPQYIAEKGSAYGIDLLGKYQKDQFYVFLGYSLGYVTRDDGVQQYYASFDRRHNLNSMVAYEFRLRKPKADTTPELARHKDGKFPFEVSVRWNVSSGFPFTRTQGFFQWQTFSGGISTPYLTNNNNPETQLGVLYESRLNIGRLPFYHRLDIAIRYNIELAKHLKLQLGASVTNAYNRDNIFYFDRVSYQRVNQLPILPAVNATLKF